MSFIFKTIFLSIEEITFIVLGISLFLFITLTIGITLFDWKISKKNKEIINHRYNMSQNIIVDFFNQEVRIVSLKNLRKSFKLSLVEYLNLFEQSEQNVIKNWMQGLLDGSIDPDIDENMVKVADSFVDFDNKKSIIKTLILCTYIDKSKKTLFFESELLLNTPADTIGKNNKRNESKYYYELSEIKNKYDKGAFSKGCLFEIRLIKKENILSTYNVDFIKVIILDAIYKVLSKNNAFFYFTNNKMELCLIDDRSITNFMLPRYVNQIKEKISEILEIRGYLNNFDFYIVSSLISDLDKNYDNSYLVLEKYFNLDLDYKRKYFIYKPDHEGKLDLEQSYRTEINRLIRNQNLEVYFRPLVHIANKRVINMGYLSFVKPVNTIFKDLDEIKKFAKMYDLDKDLFSLIIRKIIPTFINEKENVTQKLAIKVSVDQIGYATRSIPHFSGISNAYLILCFDSKELIDLEDDEDLMRGIKNLKDKGYEIGLYLTSNDYVLKRSTYSIFDYFFFNALLPNNVKVSSQEFLKAHQYLEKLIKFDAIMVGIEGLNMQSIELLVKSGLEYFSADCISPKSPMLLPLDKKISGKLLNMHK